VSEQASCGAAARRRGAAARTARPRLWVFNLDAPLELQHGGGHYRAPLRVHRAFSPILPHARRLMADDDASLELDEVRAPAAPSSGERWLGAAWCPTPSALRRLSRAGAELLPSPSIEVLCRVNHRRFYIELGGGAPGARYVSDDAELHATLAEPTQGWLFKRPFGFAGRGQRRILGVPTRDDRRWLSDSIRQGGLVAEPWLELAGEVAIHGLLDATGCLSLGQVCVQETNAYRAWVATRRATASDISPAETAQLTLRAEAVAAALSRAGYFGPFGIDAYFFRTRSGTLALNPLGELNARYTMGFAIGAAGLV
jgi:hypothetical protein